MRINVRNCHSVHYFLVTAGKVNFGTSESSSCQEQDDALSAGSACNPSTSFVGVVSAGSSAAGLSVPTQQTQLVVTGVDNERVLAYVESLHEVFRKTHFCCFRGMLNDSPFLNSVSMFNFI